MSWDSYIDNLVAQSSGEINCDKGCIISLDGGEQWTSPNHAKALKLVDGEAAAIAAPFKSKDYTVFMTSGLMVEGQKYQFLREMDGKLVLAKRKGCGSLSLMASNKAIVIGHCPEGGQQGMLNKGVVAIGDYLRQSNY